MDVIEGPRNRRNETAPIVLHDFLSINHRNLMEILIDLLQLTKDAGTSAKGKPVCHLLDCPRLSDYQKVIMDAIDIIAKTKDAFKSKDLMDLRKRFEKVTLS